MGFAPNTDLDHSTCKRIIATLLAMAVLCEHAAVRSLPFRLLVFWILRRAEAAALTLFPAPAGDASHETPVGDLILLAARLRTLALLLAQACPPQPLRHPTGRVDDLARELHGLAAWLRNSPDTS